MSKKDDIKEQIGMLKFWLGILVGSVLAMVGWAVTNFETAKVWLLLASLITSIFCLVLIILIVGKINKRIKKIKENVMETFRLIIAICMVAMLFCIPLIALKAVLDADKD